MGDSQQSHGPPGTTTKSSPQQSTSPKDNSNSKKHPIDFSTVDPRAPLLKIISLQQKKPSDRPHPSIPKGAAGGPGDFQCVLHMSPSVVGWVIGKGGT